MKIAVPITKDNEIEDHFGQCEFYNIFTISETNEIIDVQLLKSEQGCGCRSNIANILALNGIKVMLAGGIGDGAIDVLNSCEIEVIRGCSGNPTEIVKKYIEGLLIDSGLSCKQHEHHHADGHECNHK